MLDRRIHQRRIALIVANPERRTGLDRRGAEDRRRETPAMYAIDEVHLIREMLFHPGTQARCPRCHGPLVIGPPADSGEGIVREARCFPCRRTAIIGDFASE